MGEFFIIAKFQRQGIGKQVACKIWKMHHGIWEVSVIPENKSGLAFWRKTIDIYTDSNYSYEIKTVTYDKDQPKRIVFIFNNTK